MATSTVLGVFAHVDTATRAIRELRPTAVVTCDPTAWFFEDRYYNHSDHRTAGVVALDAVFPGAGNPHFFSDHLAEGLEPHSVTDVWLGWTREPNHREDITGFLQVKIDALAAHASQLIEGIACAAAVRSPFRKRRKYVPVGLLGAIPGAQRFERGFSRRRHSDAR